MTPLHSLVRLDEWLLDRLFQPVVDALHPWVGDCVLIARSCAIGYAVFTLGGMAAEQVLGTLTPLAWTSGLMSLAGVAWMVWGFSRGTGSIKGSNPLRSLQRPIRIGFLFYSAAGIGLSFLPDANESRLDDLFDAFRFLVLLSALYFVACHNRPPAERRKPVLAPQPAG